jgi:hypothetical protein
MMMLRGFPPGFGCAACNPRAAAVLPNNASRLLIRMEKSPLAISFQPSAFSSELPC